TLASSWPKTGMRTGTSLSLSEEASLVALLCDELRESPGECAWLVDHEEASCGTSLKSSKPPLDPSTRALPVLKALPKESERVSPRLSPRVVTLRVSSVYSITFV